MYIDPTLAIVCGVVFPILALTIIFSVVLIRKNQGYVYVHYVKKPGLTNTYFLSQLCFGSNRKSSFATE